ncbi:MAG: hypothetical protein A2W91_11140 [Bacteroidetes bacterium GWF2_38_335]|nr:MAG: hypothetical protein A2W91_11140 [Bacteroidetes bacterium GWF2_38_335]OFY81746.1 MAG: hypothetical protein A2281_05900 [Bacteroidetes bacterium RIFOXYA12_FULL_38_20]HBS87813.1 hypothetical protein [Bacteroidales bacterium]
MKKLTLVFAVVLFTSFAFTSCGKKSACDCLDESLAIAEEMMKMIEDGNMDEAKMKELEEKGKALEADCKDFKEEDLKDCENYSKMKDLK